MIVNNIARLRYQIFGRRKEPISAKCSCTYLAGCHDAAEVFELSFHLLDVGDELVDDGGPGLVEGLVPNGRAEAVALKYQLNW